jgi:signal peptide peptidase SppA
MKYTRVAQYVQSALWAILPEKIEDILAVLAARSAGHIFTAEEIQARIGDGGGAPRQSQQGAIAVIPLRGVVAHRIGAMEESSGGMSAERFTRMVQAAASDPAVSAILLDVDSPGGTVNGVSDAADAVYQARQQKPVVALANGYMASAAYWIASQATEIAAIPSLLEPSIGSIGVFTVHQDLSAALEQAGVKPTIISAGKYKTEGNPFEPLSEDRRAVLQKSVDVTYGQFVAAVARGRGVDAADVSGGYGEGRAMSAADAKRAGLVDRLATMDETIARLSSPQIRGKMMAGQRAEIDADNIIAAAFDTDPAAAKAATEALLAECDITAAVADALAASVDEDRARRFGRF